MEHSGFSQYPMFITYENIVELLSNNQKEILQYTGNNGNNPVLSFIN